MCIGSDEELLNNRTVGYINTQTGEALDLERARQLKDNAMLKVNPHLWTEWDFEKNDELGLDIWKMTYGSNKNKVWWIGTCGHKWDTTANHRHYGSGCPYCLNQRIDKFNSLATLNPTLSSEWHPTKNGELTPHDIAINSNKKVWWQCENGHEWKVNVATRKNTQCPYCSNKKVLVGYNDIWTTNPELASLLAHPVDGYKYTQNSGKRIDWKCKNCGAIIKNKIIDYVNRYYLSCPTCSDGFKFPEKLMHSILRYLNVDFNTQATFYWSNGKRYDFYIPLLNLIIETHGEQHYKQTTRKGARTLEEEQDNDQYKYEMAIQNGIDEYIVIDCRKSDFEYIKNNILNSRLAELFDSSDVDWNEALINSQNSIVLDVWSMYDSGEAVKSISSSLKISDYTVMRYLKRGSKISACNYSMEESKKIGYSKTYKKVVKLSLSYEYISTFNSVSEAGEVTKIHPTSIIKVCKGKQLTAGGYKWMYKVDNDKYIEEQTELA